MGQQEGRPLRVLSCKESMGQGTHKKHVTKNHVIHAPQRGSRCVRAKKKVNSEAGRQGEAWEGHALKSHCTAPEHTAKAQGKSSPAGGGQQSPSGLSAKTSQSRPAPINFLVSHERCVQKKAMPNELVAHVGRSYMKRSKHGLGCQHRQGCQRKHQNQAYPE